MTISELKTYWKKAATNNKAIGHVEGTNIHFLSYSHESVLSALKDVGYPLLYLDMPEYPLIDKGSDNVRKVTDGGVLVLKPAAPGNAEEIVQVLEETEVIAIELLTKLVNDRRKANDAGAAAPEKYIKSLDLNRVKLVDVGPVFGKLYGWRINFSFDTPINLTLDESKWNNETKWTM